MSNRIIFALALILSLAWASSALAARLLPDGVQVGQISGASYPQVRLNGTVRMLAPGSIIYDENNRTILGGNLPQSAKVFYLLDSQGQVSKIWIMTAEESAGTK
jgi:hypothetical protein